MFPTSCWRSVPRQFNLSDLLSLQAVHYHSEEKKIETTHVCGNKYCDMWQNVYVWWSSVLHENDGRGRSNQTVKKKTKEKEQWERSCEKNGFSLTLNAHKTRGFSAMRATNLSNILCVVIAINPIVIPIHANKDTFQRRCQFALIILWFLPTRSQSNCRT